MYKNIVLGKRLCVQTPLQLGLQPRPNPFNTIAHSPNHQPWLHIKRYIENFFLVVDRGTHGNEPKHFCIIIIKDILKIKKNLLRYQDYDSDYIFKTVS